MELLQYILLFVVSLAVLLKASDWFVDSAEAIGLSLGISPLIIGVTIVAFGTSLPELASSIAAVVADDSKIVIGNVVGSNITNIALVLGLTAIYAKQINLEYNIWHIDMPYLWGSAFMLWLAIRDGHFSFAESLMFLAGIVLFLAYSFQGDGQSDQEKIKASPKNYALLILGGVLVWLGAGFTIDAISKISLMFGVPSDVIAVTAVALGTSLPEVIVSLNAAKKGKTSIAVGNVLGSNIFNTYVVMAIPSFFGNLEISDHVITVLLPIMIIMTILFGIVSNNKKITRWEGVMLLLFYVFFLIETLKTTAPQ